MGPMGHGLDMWGVCHQIYQTLDPENGEPGSEEEAVGLYRILSGAAWATPPGQEGQLPGCEGHRHLTVGDS